MKAYIVKWAIKVEATSHSEAAKRAHAIFCGQPATTHTYHVRVPHEKGRLIRIGAEQD